jgi:ABC-2 type transport system ATP-binding protein
MTSSDIVIEVEGLTKSFGDRVVVRDLSMRVKRGTIYGFLGPNGSGKTTTIRMLLGLIYPTRGSVRLLGDPVPGAAARVLPRVGSLVEGPAFYPYLSGRANLARIDAADRTADPRTAAARIDAALDRVGLLSAAKKRYRAYSLGMKQRLAIATSLLQPRELIILDEPTNGLDPQGMREIRAMVRELAADGTTVFLSSHLLDEIEQVCTHAAVMTRGRLVTQGPVAELSAGARGRLAVTTPDAAEAARVLGAHGVREVSAAGGRVTGELPADPPDLAELNAALVAAGVRVRGFGLERASLEDAFVALTGEGFDVAG